MNAEGNESTEVEPELLERSAALQLGKAAVEGTAAGVATGLTAHVMSHLPRRQPNEEPPKIELPPGVERD
jgi:hypothetical protein